MLTDKPVSYVALLRGINVSGQKLIKMEYLREVFAALPVQNIRTYIQSGNVLFNSNLINKTELQELIQQHLHQVFGYNIPVILRTIPELVAIIEQNPFGQNLSEGTGKLYVTFLATEPTPVVKQALLACNNESETYYFGKQEVYCFIRPAQTGRDRYSNNFLEKILKIPATTRNWATVQKLTKL